MFSDGLDSIAARIKSFSAHFYQQVTRQPVDLASMMPLFSYFSTQLIQHLQQTSCHTLASQHEWYIFFVPPILLTRLIPPSQQSYTPMITYLASLNPPIPFDFGEVACGPGSIPDSTYILERSLGAALWQIDFMLYSMTVGVNRVHIQSGYGFNFSLWQPNEFAGSPAAVYANYYAHVFVASLIGRSGAMQAIELDVSPTSDTHTAYAAYDNGALSRVALVNMDYFDGTTSDASSRSSTNFTVAVPQGVKDYTIHTLTAPEGAMAIDTAGIFFAGQTYTLEQDGMAQMNSTVSTISNGTVQDGQVTVTVAASEAVILYMGDVGMNGTNGTATSTSSVSTSSTTTPTSTGGGLSPAAATESKKGAASGLGVQMGVVMAVAVLTALVL
jgi:hypothetical protein